eukprot:TRINITY_DN9129_c0_g11_i1.p1 TRINITY_DN9129_c0_g11~~TRINITY_DN9129_c0_g11_i1.p1  ORF type:complete len:461 (+),score=168.64 TRINITY_DN9129_c0_g11_i1:121-1503(+)
MSGGSRSSSAARAGSDTDAGDAPVARADPAELLQTSSSVCDSWTDFDFDGTIADFASRYELIIENMEKGTQAKQSLVLFSAQFTDDLRRRPSDAPVPRPDVDRVLSFFKGVFEGLLIRCRNAESAYIDLYTRVASLADPTPLLRQLASLGSEYDTVRTELRAVRGASEQLQRELAATQESGREARDGGAAVFAGSEEREQLLSRVAELEELARGKQSASVELRKQYAAAEKVRLESEERLLAVEDALRAATQERDSREEALADEAAQCRLQVADAMAACRRAEQERDEARETAEAARAAATAALHNTEDAAAQTDGGAPGVSEDALSDLAAVAETFAIEWAAAPSDRQVGDLCQAVRTLRTRAEVAERRAKAAATAQELATRARDQMSAQLRVADRPHSDHVVVEVQSGADRRSQRRGGVVMRTVHTLLAHRWLRMVVAIYAVLLHVLVAGVLYYSSRPR